MKQITGNSYRLVPPNEALYQLNQEMVERETTRVQFATACYGLLNCYTHELKFARAGHPLPMVLRTDGTTEYIDADGPLLGIFSDEHFELVNYQLRQGDRLLFYSDGFELAFGELSKGKSDEGEIDTERYLTEFNQLRRGTPQQSLGELQRKIESQPGSLHQQDDMTVIMIEIGCEQSINTSEQRDKPQAQDESQVQSVH